MKAKITNVVIREKQARIDIAFDIIADNGTTVLVQETWGTSFRPDEGNSTTDRINAIKADFDAYAIDRMKLAKGVLADKDVIEAQAIAHEVGLP